MSHADPPAGFEVHTLVMETGEPPDLAPPPGGGSGEPCLELVGASGHNERWPLNRPRLTLGRSAECDIRIDSVGISRRHAQLLQGSTGIALCDLNSSNGTYVNERRLQGPEVLREGDVLRLGESMLRFHARRRVDALPMAPTMPLLQLGPMGGTVVLGWRPWIDQLERGVAGARQADQPLALLCVALDDFQALTPRVGRKVADAVLERCAGTVLACVRAADVVGRLGGETLGVLLPDCAPNAARVLAERIRQAVSLQRFELAPLAGGPAQPHRQTVSVGLAQLEPDIRDAPDLLRAAEHRLYAARHTGGDQAAA
ncbi:MAG: diguanylate cyclase domain-containing protein [Aquabacterium sp.]